MGSGRAPFLKNKIFVANNIYIYQFIHFHLNNQTDCLAIACVINFSPIREMCFFPILEQVHFRRKKKE